MRRSRKPCAAPLTALILLGVSLGGCERFGDVTGSVRTAAIEGTNDEGTLRAQADERQKRYEQNAGEKGASIDYARSLRALTRYAEAAAVMQTAAVKAPKDEEVLSEYGKALADAGQFAQAREVLTRASTPDNPRWDVLSVQGAIADRLGDHAAAMQFYRDALKIAPGEPSILTNMGVSYALAKELPDAERALRQAAASPKAESRTRGDLALVLALEGKYSEAEKVARPDLSSEEAHANVETIRLMTLGARRGTKPSLGDANAG